MPLPLHESSTDDQAEATLHLWSAGNVRLPTGRDLTVPPQEALELIDVMAADVRVCLFVFVFGAKSQREVESERKRRAKGDVMDDA